MKGYDDGFTLAPGDEVVRDFTTQPGDALPPANRSSDTSRTVDDATEEVTVEIPRTGDVVTVPGDSCLAQAAMSLDTYYSASWRSTPRMTAGWAWAGLFGFLGLAVVLALLLDPEPAKDGD